MTRPSVFPSFLKGLLLAFTLAILTGCAAVHTPIPCLYDGDRWIGCKTTHEQGKARYLYLTAAWKAA